VTKALLAELVIKIKRRSDLGGKGKKKISQTSKVP
jgi:hypothetical protein